ncbi:GNAT family N-acetyltransferase [Paracidovorax avenae]
MLFSPLDSHRFSRRIGKASISDVQEVDTALAAAESEQLELLIARCPADAVSVLHAMEERGFRLMDTLVYLRRPVNAGNLDDAPRSVRQACAADAAAVEDVARAAFRGYVGHYHSDARLDGHAADQIYPDWARRAVEEPGVADSVLVYEDEASRICGFAAMRRLDDARCDGMLFAVDPGFQKRGIFGALLRASLSWTAANGYAQMEYSTHLRNASALRGVAGHGFYIYKAVHTFHCWTKAQ